MHNNEHDRQKAKLAWQLIRPNWTFYINNYFRINTAQRGELK